MVKIKICGLTNLEDAALCERVGVNFLGFVTEYPLSVPWNLSREKTKSLIKGIRDKVSTVVVTSGSFSHILEVVYFTHPHFVQLHGFEDPEMIKRIVKELRKEKIKVIKALSLKEKGKEAYFKVQDPLEAAKILEKSGIFALTLDSCAKNLSGGTGIPLDWKLAKKIRESISIPMILAGGLNSFNVEKAIEIVKPYGIDVLSGVESLPGKKDEEKIISLVKTVRRVKINAT